MLAPSVLNEDASTVPDTTGRGNRSGQFRTHLSEKYRPAPSRWASASVHEPSEPAKMAPRASGRLRGPRAASRRSRRVDAVLAHDRAKVDGNYRLAPLGRRASVVPPRAAVPQARHRRWLGKRQRRHVRELRPRPSPQLTIRSVWIRINGVGSAIASARRRTSIARGRHGSVLSTSSIKIASRSVRDAAIRSLRVCRDPARGVGDTRLRRDVCAAGDVRSGGVDRRQRARPCRDLPDQIRYPPGTSHARPTKAACSGSSAPTSASTRTSLSVPATR
jgi:hypothetical protein